MSDGGDCPECLECGACCFSNLPTYARVSGDDHARLGAAADALTVFIENRCYMRIEGGRCAALHVAPEGRFVCSIYDRRPTICRTLDRGSPACAAERHEKRARAERARLSLL